MINIVAFQIMVVMSLTKGNSFLKQLPIEGGILSETDIQVCELVNSP